MNNKKSALLAGMFAAAIAGQDRKDIYEFTNHYAGLNGLTSIGDGRKRYFKSPLTKKQKKARASAKRAKQSRKRNR